MADLINIRRHFLYSTEIFAVEAFFCFYTNFLKNILTLGSFPSVPNMVDNYAKNVDERGRNFMCEHTLPSLFVLVRFNLKILFSTAASLPYNSLYFAEHVSAHLLVFGYAVRLNLVTYFIVFFLLS